jgi:hypothetical protein
MTENNGELVPTRLVIFEVEGEKPSLETAQGLVGGWVEMLTLANGDQMLVNEEGLIHNLPHNPIASALAGRNLVGNAVLLKGEARWD